MKLLWLTDIHLNFLKDVARLNVYQEITEKQSDALLITGDIAEAHSVGKILQEMCRHIKKPIYFVLGNHDYYRGRIDSVKKEMQWLTTNEPLLYWLPFAGVQDLDNNIMLVGQDGWADGRLGDYYNSEVSLNDSHLIADLLQQKTLGKKQLLEKMQQLADDDALGLQNQLHHAIAKHPKKVMILTHVPPFKEASTYNGKISDDSYLPFFASKATGDVLLQFAAENSTVEFLVLCGHTHGKANYQPLHNLIVKTGKAEYYRPVVQEVFNTSINR
ncbi:metallophosphoesterase [soil metagenome]